jgi:hypothetical protein
MVNLAYNGQTFRQREDGFVNLGELCAAHTGKIKQFSNWLRTQSAQDHLKALAETLTQSGPHIYTPEDLIVPEVNAIGGNAGTWGHPLVAIEVARWISPEFGVWCNMNIKTLMEKGSVSLSTPKTYIQALKDLVAAEEEKERLAIEVKMLEQDNERLAEITDELFDYSSIIRIAKFNGVSETNFKWQRLKSTAIQLGLEIKSAPCPRFSRKLLYPHCAYTY